MITLLLVWRRIKHVLKIYFMAFIFINLKKNCWTNVHFAGTLIVYILDFM